MVLHCLISPYIFLMNSSHNKNLVIQYGWKNVIINLFGFKTDNNSSSNNQENIVNSNQKNMRNDIKQIKSNQQPEPTKTKDSPPNDLFIVSQFSRTRIPDSVNNGPELNTPYIDKPSTSFRTQPNQNDTITNHQQLLANCSPNRSSIDEDEFVAHDESMQDILSVYINILLDVVKDEYWYMYFFKQLAEFYGFCNNGMNPTEAKNKVLNNGLLNDGPNDWSIQKRFTLNKDDLLSSKYIEGKIFLDLKCDEEFSINHGRLKGKKEGRELKRTKILIQLQQCEDHENYIDLVEQLLDLEESFKI